MLSFDHSYTSDHQIEADGSVSFTCSQESDHWPWLALSPQHPLVIQTQNFWSSVGAGQALGTRDDDKWTALTSTSWELVDCNAGMAASGSFKRTGKDGKLEFSTQLFDQHGRIIVRTKGKGVVFRTRNFEKWREKSKEQAKKSRSSPLEFEYADQAQLGLSDKEPPLLAPLGARSENRSITCALITKENGLIPGHPYFSGTGDHVNTPHLAELGRQAACLINDGRPVLINSAQMHMRHYIELGTQIDVSIEQLASGNAEIEFCQLGKPCASMQFHWTNLPD